ncbi:MAG TPA: isocitrate lyase/phosphoenolpyruvate mutase family protein [Dermatophilaceae bacterium]
MLPNAWDDGSDFPAIATTSAGIAWSCGVADGEALDRDRMLEHVGRIVAAVGGNLEDAGKGKLFGIDEAIDRLAAARAAAPSDTFVLNARTDTNFAGTSGDAFAETVERAVRYVEAGPAASSSPASSRRTRSGGSPQPSRARSTWWPGWRTSSTRPPSSPSASSG